MPRISEALSGNWKKLEELRASGKQLSEKEQVALARATGAYINGKGEIVAAMVEGDKIVVTGNEKIIKSQGEFIQSQGDAFKEVAEEGVPADTLLAQEQVAQTTALTKIIEQGVEYWLELIYGVVEKITVFFTGAGEKEEKQKALYVLGDRITKQQEALKATSDALAKANAEMTGTKGADRRKAADKVAALKTQLASQQEGLDRTTQQRQRVVREADSGTGRSATRILAATAQGGLAGETRREFGASAENVQKRVVGSLQEQLRTKVMGGKSEAERSAAIRKEAVDLVMKQRRGKRDETKIDPDGKTVSVIEGTNTVEEMQWAREAKEGKGNKFTSGELEAAMKIIGGAKEKQMSVMEEQLALKGGEITEAAVLGTKADVGFGPDKKAGITEDMAKTLNEILETGDTAGLLTEMRKEQAKRDREATAQQAAQKKAADAEAAKGLLSPTGKTPMAIATATATQLANLQSEKDIIAALQEADIKTDTPEMMAQIKALAAHGDVSTTAMWEMLNKQGAHGTTVGKQIMGAGVNIRGGVEKLGKPAKDFLMHIGSDGQVKFAQRIDGSDTLAVASKAGGGLSKAGRGGGGGGNVVNNHFYNDGQGIFASMKRWNQANGN